MYILLSQYFPRLTVPLFQAVISADGGTNRRVDDVHPYHTIFLPS
jgi:hypothetical protein